MFEIFYLSHTVSTCIGSELYKQHILSQQKVRNVCYSLAEIYVKSVYLDLFRWRGREVRKTFRLGRKL
jgi:hypothetical protein